nr:MAG TPA: hypothetical protein [Caudoviricetes sp.]
MTSRNFILSEDNIKNLINAARASLHEELFPDTSAPEALVFDGNYDMPLDDILIEECGCLPLYDTDCGNWSLPRMVETLRSRYAYLVETGEDPHELVERAAINIILILYDADRDIDIIKEHLNSIFGKDTCESDTEE